MKKYFILTLLLTCLIVSTVFADWAQFMGPTRNGVSSEKGLLKKWPRKGPEVLWTVDIGEGFSGPAISEGKVYLLDRIEDKKDDLRCFDLNTGKEEWNYSYKASGKFAHPGSRTVPTIDGDYIYTCGGHGHVHCFNKKTQKIVWKANIWEDFGGGDKYPKWGLSQNPLIYKDMLILAPQSKEAGVVAYDKLTGKIKWKSKKLPGKVGYVTPEIFKIGNEDNLVMISAKKKKKKGDRNKNKNEKKADLVVGMDPNNGEFLWSYGGWACRIPIPNLTDVGGGRFLVTGGYDSGSAMFKVQKKGSKYDVKELFTTMDFGTHIHSPILYKGYLYAHCSDNSRKDGMVCMSLDGKVQWQTKKRPLFDKGGFILVDDMMISVDGNKGSLYLTKPNPKGYEEISSARMLNRSKCWAPLALTDGKLLIRDFDQMKCVKVK